jgi:SAM-dependent methyltransferase
VLWGGITLLALAAGARRRARSRAIRARFEAEERREAEARGEALAGGEPAPPGQAGARDLAFFIDRYAGGVPPWDIGRPQAEFARLADERAFHGSVLDVGCGTGENALYVAGFGNEVWGIDGAPLAIEKAQRRADARGIAATFVVGDALALTDLGRTFDTAIDSGLFHVFPDDDRERYVRGLAAVVNPGGRFFMLCFSEHEPGSDGPRRVTRDEIRAAFRDGWRVESIRAARFETNREGGDVRAWLAVVARVEETAT